MVEPQRSDLAAAEDEPQVKVVYGNGNKMGARKVHYVFGSTSTVPILSRNAEFGLSTSEHFALKINMDLSLPAYEEILA